MKWLGKVGFRLLKEQTGFSLIEVIVAVAIFALIGVTVLRALDTNYRAVGILDEQVVATNLATAHFEAISKSPYADNYDDIVDNINIPAQYDVNYSIDFSVDGYTWGDTYSTLQRITIFVSHGEKPVLSMCTYKADK